MIYFMPIDTLDIIQTFLFDETAKAHPSTGRELGAWVKPTETSLEFMRTRLNKRGNKDIFVFVSAYNKSEDLAIRQTPQLLKVLTKHDLTKHIHYEKRGLTNEGYAPGNIDLFILTRKTRTSKSRITLESLNA